MERFKEKVVIVTGAASGIGEAATRRIVAEGGKVVIADYAEDRAKQLAAFLEEEGADVRPVFFSAAEEESCRKLVGYTLEEYGRIDVLVNNVGGTDLSRDTDIATVDPAYFDEAFHINLRSALLLTRLAVSPMVEQGGGCIVNIASIGGLTADVRGIYYGMAKAGLISLTRYTATQMGKKNIRCNAIAPGLILTPAALRNLPGDLRHIFLRHNALNELGCPEDVAAAIAFLASEDARYITGQTLVVDGGLTIHNPTIADVNERS